MSSARIKTDLGCNTNVKFRNQKSQDWSNTGLWDLLCIFLRPKWRSCRQDIWHLFFTVFSMVQRVSVSLKMAAITDLRRNLAPSLESFPQKSPQHDLDIVLSHRFNLWSLLKTHWLGLFLIYKLLSHCLAVLMAPKLHGN